MVSRKSSSRSDGEVFQKASTYTLGAFFMHRRRETHEAEENPCGRRSPSRL